MLIVDVESIDDPRIVHYTGLTDMQMRMVTEPAAGIFLAEGEKVIRRALAAGLQMVSALMEPKWLPPLQANMPADVPVFLAPAPLLEAITGFRLHRGALAVFARPEPRSAEQVVKGADTLVLLEDLVDHTNVGAVFRSAAGLGIDAVLVTARCADPWYRRSVKTSMGAVFTLPWATVADTGTAISMARQSGVSTIALDPSADTSIRGWRRTGPTMLLMGTEGPGLSAMAKAGTDLTLSIPMARGTDSLNVAMAAAIACYALTS